MGDELKKDRIIIKNLMEKLEYTKYRKKNTIKSKLNRKKSNEK